MKKKSQRVEKEELEELLQKFGSIRAVARSLGLHHKTLLETMKKWGIEGPKGTRASHCVLSSKLCEFLDGLLLGGGSLSQKWPHGVAISFSSVESQLVQWIKKELKNLGIEGQIYTKKEGRGRKPSFVYESRDYYELLSLKNRWYRKGKKDVPKDLILTPQVCKLWFILGGSLQVKGKRAALRFWVGRFSKEGVEHLLGQLRSLGISPKLYCYPPKIKILWIGSKLEVFSDYIGPCPEELEGLFGHKWKILTRGK
ncbi:hypothetical protein H5T58_03625 [Candidatus Parcubacteria bacterium]|nr:hypothetical protein [Candidatus Parcubacteria bacterium]